MQFFHTVYLSFLSDLHLLYFRFSFPVVLNSRNEGNLLECEVSVVQVKISHWIKTLVDTLSISKKMTFALHMSCQQNEWIFVYVTELVQTSNNQHFILGHSCLDPEISSHVPRSRTRCTKYSITERGRGKRFELITLFLAVMYLHVVTDICPNSAAGVEAPFKLEVLEVSTTQM